MAEGSSKIGALWLAESKGGMKYMKGSIEIDGVKHKIAVFKNTKKDKETQPDYNILGDRPQEDRPRQERSQQQDDSFSEDIPF
jgi:uncharacterized protein (DUF736 family)